MGQAKHDWMEQQELQPMYDWIEETYGDDVDLEDESSWSMAVQSYHDYVARLEMERARARAAEEFSYFFHLTLSDVDAVFSDEISNLKQFVNDGKPEIPIMFYKMCFAHAVTLFEVYIEGIAKTLIAVNPEFVTNYVRNSNVIASKNISLKDIYINEDALKNKLTIESLTEAVMSDLSSTLFHDVDKILAILGSMLGRDLEINRAPLKKIMHIRHDIVHRNGVNREGKEHTIDKESVINAVDTLYFYAKEIRYEIERSSMSMEV